MVNRIADSVPFVPANASTVSSVTEAPNPHIQPSVADSFPGSSQSSSEAQAPTPLSPENAKKMTESINRFMETTNTNLRFQYHEDLKEYYVTIVDSKTNELVKEIPSKKLMDIYAAMRDFLGLMVDHKI